MIKNNGIAFIFLLLTVEAFAHCQIPCGIYDDQARLLSMKEHVSTLQKSVREIIGLEKKQDALSFNQRVRWVNNKEAHADEIIKMSTDYFLTQRVKPSQKDYNKRLELHHKVMIQAMKVKQTVDLNEINILDKLIDELRLFYPAHKH